MKKKNPHPPTIKSLVFKVLGSFENYKVLGRLDQNTPCFIDGKFFKKVDKKNKIWIMWKKYCAKPRWDEEATDGQS